MTDKLRLNKNSLREQNERLGTFSEFLPTLRLRKQQLQAAVGRVQRQRAQCQRRQQALRAQVEPWAAMLGSLRAAAGPFAEVERVVTRTTNVAGVMVPRLDEVCFVPRLHDLLATPLIFDDAVAVLRKQAQLAAEGSVLREQERRLTHELSRTSQRINLYEKVLVPQARRNIRRLRVYLGDQQTAAVCRAKLAKAKLTVRPGRPAQGVEHGRR